MPYITGADTPIDVICQHSRDGSIIPIKIKLSDEDGETHIFRIGSYRVLLENGSHVLPGGVHSSDHIWTFECRICIFGMQKQIYLMYNAFDGIWSCRV